MKQGDKMFFLENELLLEISGVFRLYRDAYSNRSIPRNYDSISIRTNGIGHFEFSDGKKSDAKKGDIMYIPKNAEYFQKTDGETLIVVHFINYSFDKSNKIEVLSLDISQQAEEIFRKMYHSWTEKKPGYRHECTSLLYHLLYIINGSMKKDTLSSVHMNEHMKAAVNFIHQNYKKQQISIEELAKTASVSQSYFRREFKKIYSVPPGQYIINLRLEYASQLLQSRLYTVSEVAEKSGFSDVKYFSRLFKRRFSKSPSEYKNTNIEKTFFEEKIFTPITENLL